MSTPFMNLDLPVVSTTIGPDWASKLNESLETVDAHDHTSGKGTKVPTAGLNIDNDLSLEQFRLTLAKSVKFDDQSATLTGILNASSVYSRSGDLYYTNGSGVAIQLTSGSSIISVPSSSDNFEYQTYSSSVVIGNSDTVVILGMNTSAPRTVTLPSASAVAPGRIYCVVDLSGQSETNTLTIATSGGDTILGGTSLAINSNYSSTFVAGDGVSKWVIL